MLLELLPAPAAHERVLAGACALDLYADGENPVREPDDFLLPPQWQPVEPATYVLTVAFALWRHGNN